MVRKILLIMILICILSLISCNKTYEYSGLDEFEVIDVDIEGLSDRDTHEKSFKEVEMKYPVADLTVDIVDNIIDEIELKENLKSIYEFRITDDRIIVLDGEDSCIKILDFEGNLTKKIGKLGSGEMEFKKPTAFYFDENSKNYYILDDGNDRVVVLDKNFDFVKNINVNLLKEKSNRKASNSIVIYRDKIYMSQTYGREKHMAIMCIDKDGNELLFKQKFGGFLKVIDNKLYAVENMRGFKAGKEINSSMSSHELQFWNQCGDSIYIVEDDVMKKLQSLLSGSRFTDMIKINDKLYLAGASFGFLYEYALDSSKMIFNGVISRQIKAGENVHLTKRFMLQEHDGNIFMAENGTNKIYIIDPNN